jgi:hypothetical protein
LSCNELGVDSPRHDGGEPDTHRHPSEDAGHELLDLIRMLVWIEVRSRLLPTPSGLESASLCGKSARSILVV